MTRPHDAQTPMTFTECCAIPSCPKCGGKVNTSVNTFHTCLDKKCGWGQSGNAHDAAYAHLVAELTAERERVREETFRKCVELCREMARAEFARQKWQRTDRAMDACADRLSALSRAESDRA